MKWRVARAEACGPHSLDLTFKDGTRKQVDLLSLLEGPSRCATPFFLRESCSIR